MKDKATFDIPDSFQSLGRTIRTEYAPALLDASGAEGEWLDTLNQIRIRKAGKDHRHSFLEHTYLHEVVHVFFDMAGRPELSKDETLVDVMGGLLHQFLTTLEYDS